MSYQKHNFQPGDVLLAEQLNEMDNQIVTIGNCENAVIDTITEPTYNIFDIIKALSSSEDITYENGEFIGLTQAFRSFVLVPHEDINIGTINISFDAYSDNNEATSLANLMVCLKNENDGNVSYKTILAASTTTYTHFSYSFNITNNVYYIRFGASVTTSENVWHVKNILIKKNTSESEYISPLSAIDLSARSLLHDSVIPKAVETRKALNWISGFLDVTWENKELSGLTLNDKKVLSTSGLIPCKGGDSFTYINSNSSNTILRIAYYGENENPITSEVLSGASGTKTLSLGTISRYIKFRLVYSDISVIRPVEGYNSIVLFKSQNGNEDTFLPSSGDDTDRTSEILSKLSVYGYCKLGHGDFYVANLNMPANTTLEGSGTATRIILPANATGYAVKMNDFCIVENASFYGSIEPITISSTVGNRHGIGWVGNFTATGDRTIQPKQGLISDCIFKHFNGGAITCDDTGPRVDCGVSVVNVQMYGCDAGINIAYRSEFCRFTNVCAYQCYYGCVNNGGNNMLVNCGFSDCKVGFIVKMVDGSGRSLVNNTHGSAIGCVFNHLDRDDTTLGKGEAIHIEDAESCFVFADGQIFYGSIYIKNSVGIMIKGFNIGRVKNSQGVTIPFPITVETDDGSTTKRVFFEGCIFIDQPNVTMINTSGSSQIIWNNCYTRNGTPVPSA